MGTVLLFLDFDGVLHPELSHESGYFRCLPVLEVVLRANPSVSVVITSSWRHHHPLAELLEPFSEDLRPRIEGTTRHADASGARNRYDEIMDYVRFHAETRPFVVLDDSRFEFPTGWNAAIFCDPRTGLTQTKAAELSRRLSYLYSVERPAPRR